MVSQLKLRGAMVVGKTNLDEFGMGAHSANSAHGPVAQEQLDDHQSEARGNATRPLLSAGGSSGGSALAVAAGTADLALGTDTGGSVRLPAAYCGVVGYKPSYGMISRHGVVPYANSLDTVGFLTRDVGAVRDLVVGPGGLHAEHDPRDPTSLSAAARRRCTAGREHYSTGAGAAAAGRTGEDLLRSLTFGVPAEYNVAELAAPVRCAWASAAAFLRDALGARVVPVSLPSTRHALSAYYVIAPAEASSNLAKYDGVRYGPRQHAIEGPQKGYRGKGAEDSPAAPLYSAVRGQGFGPEVKRRILLGSYSLSSEAVDNYFVQAQRVRRLVRRDFDRVFRLTNPLLDDGDPHTRFDLSELNEAVPLDDKRGPPQVDFLLCPTAPTLPPSLDEVRWGQEERPVDSYVNDVFTVPASLAGLPAVSIPRRIQVEGRGVGVMGLQIIGQYWDDARLLAVADAMSTLGR